MNISQEVQLELRNLIIPHQIAGSVEHALTDLKDEAPSESFMCAVFSKSKGAILGEVTVSSAEAIFHTKGAGKTVLGLTYQLVDQLKDQMNEWRHERHL